MKKSRVITMVVAVLVIIGAAVYRFNLQSGANEFNRIVAMMNEADASEAATAREKFVEAATAWETFVEDCSRRFRDDANENLVKCYLAIGNDPGVPAKEQAEWYAKAHAIDPGKLTETQRKTMEVFGEGQ